MPDEGTVSIPVAMDLNLYIGPPRSSFPRSLHLGSDLSLTSFPPPPLSNSGEIRALEATSGAMEASASHSFIVESDAPSVNPWPPDLQIPMPPCFLAYEPYLPSCAQEAEAPSFSNCLSNARGLQIELLGVDPAERDEQRNSSFDENLGLHLPADDSVPTADFQDEHLLRSPDFCIGSLIQSHDSGRSCFGQFIHGVDRTNFSLNSSPNSTQLMLETTSSQPNGKRKSPAETIDAESSENGPDKIENCSTNFECNVCFDISKEPVVTPCGHLFCWPCLYVWLHVHSQHRECPVCKGKLVEAKLTPIYGRGSSGPEMESKDEERRAFGLWIPPRPRGLRLESWRQRFLQNSRRIGEALVNPRRFLNYQLSSRDRLVGLDDVLMQEILRREPPCLFTSSMIISFERGHGITETGPSSEESLFLRHDGLLPADGGVVPVPDESANFGGGAGGSFSENTDRHGLSTSVQVSLSSTLAMISGESSVRDASTEPNSAGSSRPPRMTRGSSAASDDADDDDGGGNLRSSKRRMLH